MTEQSGEFAGRGVPVAGALRDRAATARVLAAARQAGR